ncbi:uncharacterized protein N7511_004872 [Penicillium nucicola]|uniref:uncharacterized protein n=1 Tax=Penicillium nucicola TaxID=1850975 RepID=UPI002545B7D6|nr:uncharacterized protein N7511_004872 [Penicillium nucicola]KAJ5767256.1 hypothetical protein N7511_004872 [Penicillium nucicola]
MFEKLKNKLHRHKHDEREDPKPRVNQKVNEAPKPPPSAPADQKPVAALKAEQPKKQPDAPKDLWLEALKSLPPSKQEQLSKMGFDQSSAKSASVEGSIDELVKAVDERQKECEKKFWKVKVGDQDIVLRDYTNNIVDWLEKAGDIAIQFAPPQAALPWSAIKSLMQVPVIEGEQMAALLATTEKIVSVISRGQVYESVYLKNTAASSTDNLSKHLESSLTKIYKTSLDLLSESGTLFSKSTATRTLQALLNPGKVSGGLTDIGSQEDDLLRDVSACEVRRSADADDSMVEMLGALNAPMKRVDKGIQHLLQQVDEKEHTEMLEWISTIPFGENHNNIREQRTPGTGKWLLQNKSFNEWEKVKSSIFWLQGSPGTGKTYLTSTIIDDIKDQLQDTRNSEGFAFFYCDKNERSRSEPQSILQSIVRQLSTTVNSPESAQTQLHELYKQCRKEGSTFSLSQCKQQIQLSIDIFDRTTIVIDAMDECDADSRDVLIDALKAFIAQSENSVRIFISSRPDPDIENQMENTPNLPINASDNKSDIHKYLIAELERITKKKRFVQNMKEDIINALLDRCQGMFQLAALQTHQISRCNSPLSVEKQLASLPDTLQKAYDEAWSQIEDLEETEQMLAKRAILWVMAAEQPLNTSQILCAIRVNTNGEEPALAEEIDEQGLMSSCNNLLALDSQLKVWRFAHLSVRDYLESNRKWSLPGAHLHAATACLSWLNTKYEGEDGEINFKDWDINVQPTDIFNFMHPFHVYMRHWWIKHVQAARDDEKGTLATLLKTFFGSPSEGSKQYQRWFEVIAGDDDKIVAIGYGSSVPGSYRLYAAAAGQGDKGVDLCGFNQAPSPYHDAWQTDLEADAPIFAICHFALYDILSDWWQDAEFDASLVNNRGHTLLTVAAQGGSAQICRALIERGANVSPEMKGRAYISALEPAVRKGHFDTVKYLVEVGANVNTAAEDRKHPTALAAAISAGHIEIAKYLITEGHADVNQSYLEVEQFGWTDIRTPIALAVKLKNLELLKTFVGAQVNVNIADPSGHPLFAAMNCGYIEGAKYLIQEGNMDVNLVISSGMTPDESTTLLQKATSVVGTFEIVKALVGAGANLNPPVKGIEKTPLELVICQQKPGESKMEVVKYLVEAGADIHREQLGKYALYSKDFEVVQYLVDAGGISDLTDRIEEATRGGLFEAVKYIIERGRIQIRSLRLKAMVLSSKSPQKKKQGNFGTALIAAASVPDNIEMLRCLVEAGADVNALPEQGEWGSALATAAYHARDDYTKFLLGKGADVNALLKGGEYSTALIAAAAATDQNIEVLETLIEAGADVKSTAEDRYHENALDAAVGSGHRVDTVKLLVKSGCSLNEPFKYGDFGSPLAMAAYNTDVEMVEFLIEQGADVNMSLENGKYRNALAAAKDASSGKGLFDEDNSDEVIELLRQHGATD